MSSTTVSTLFPQTKSLADPTSCPSFDSSNLILTQNEATVPPDKVKGQIKALVQAAEKAATSLAYSSMLAGAGSESDENGDVGIWLGKGQYGAGHENEVLKALALEGWAQGEEVRNII